MADDVDTLVAELQAVVDVDTTAAVRLLNRRHRQMAARALTYKGYASPIVTVANQSSYSVTDVSNRPVLAVHTVTVDGAEFSRGKRSDYYQWQQGSLVFAGYGLFFADAVAGGGLLWLVPPPDTAGLSVDVYCSMIPPDLVSGGGVETIHVDFDLLDALVDGAAATELARIGEGDPASLEAKFQAATEQLRVRERRRLKGSGNVQVRIRGVNA